MTQAAKRQPSFGTRIKQLKDGEKDLYSMARTEIGNAGRVSQGISTAGSGGINIGLTFGGGPSIGNFLMTSGDTMIGPIAYFGDNSPVPLSGDTLDVAVGGDGYHSRVVAAAEAGTADDLSTISGAFWAGQILNLQADTGDTITIKHGIGNIRLDTAADYVLGGDANILLVFDEVNNQWTNQHPLVAGAGGVFANRNLDNLLAPTLISVDLLPVAGDTYDLGDGVDDWKSLFVNNIRLQAGGVGVGGAEQIWGDAFGVNLTFGVGLKFQIFENLVPVYDFDVTRSIHPSIIIGGGLNQLNINSATAPGAPVDGQFWHDSADNHLYARTGATTVDLTDIGTGAAGANIQLSNLDVGLVRINTDLEPVTSVADHNLGTAARYWQNLEVQRVRFQENLPPTGSTFIQGRADFSGQDDMYFNVPLNSGFRFLEAGSGGTLVFIDPVTNRVRFEEEINRLDIEGDSAGTFVWSIIAPLGAAANATYSLAGTTGGHQFLNPVKFGIAGIEIEDDGDADFNVKNIFDINNITTSSNGDLLGFRDVQGDAFRYVNDPTVVYLDMTGAGHDLQMAASGDAFRAIFGGVPGFTVNENAVTVATNWFTILNDQLTISHATRAHIDIGDIPEPASPAGGFGRIFLDDAIAPGILKIKHSDGSVISLEGAGGGSQTPWLTTINAAENDLINIKDIKGRDTGATGSFKIIFDANEDSDTYISDNIVNDTVDFVAGNNVAFQLENRTENSELFGLSMVFSSIDMLQNLIQFTESTDPATPATNKARLFLRSSDGALSVKKDNGDVISLEQGGAGGGADLDLGNLTATNINQNLRPDGDNNRDLGAPGREWRDLYIDGVANIDALSVHVGPNAIGGGLGVSGTLFANNDFQVLGDTQLGNSTSDDIFFLGRMTSNIIPSITGRDLGDSSRRWDLWVRTLRGDGSSWFLSGSNINDVGNLEIDGDLNHDGSRVGFYNSAPQTQQTVNFAGFSLGSVVAQLNTLLIVLKNNGLIN